MSSPVYLAARQVGTTGEIASVYLQATTGAFLGLQNIFASTVSAAWFRSDATGASSIQILSTANLGTYSSGNWRQINSTFQAGWYQFGIPGAAFSSGRSLVVHIYSSSNIFSPVGLYYELTKTDNQNYVSTQPFNIERVYQSAVVTTFPGILQVDVTTVLGRVVDTSAPGLLTVDVSTIQGGNAVTTAAGVLGVGAVGVSSFTLRVGVSSIDQRVGVSSFDQPVGVSSFGIRVGVSSFGLPVDVTSVYGSALVTTAAGIFAAGPVGVSSFGLRVGVSSFNSPVGVSSFGITVGVSSVQDKAGYGVSSNADKTDYGISSFGFPVGVSSFGVAVGVSTLVEANIKYVNDIEVKGTGTTADPWNPI